MGTETKYRVGVLIKIPTMGSGYVASKWMGPGTDPLRESSFVRQKVLADEFGPHLAMTWVQVLAARHDCVLVERVEVAQ